MVERRPRVPSHFPRLKDGYLDGRYETISLDRLWIRNHQVQGRIHSVSDGHLLRVASEDGFRVISDLPSGNLRETPFSGYVKGVWQKEGSDPISPARTEGRPLPAEWVEEARGLATPEIEIGMLSRHRVVHFVNSLGASRVRDEDLESVRIDLRSQARAGTIHLRRFLYDLSKSSLSETVTEMKELAQELQVADSIRPAAVPLVLHPSVSSVLIHETIGHRLEMATGNRPLSTMTGKSIASSEVTVTDRPQEKDSVVQMPFDDEGISSKDVTLVDRGIWLNVFCGLGSGYRLHSEPNGHSRARDFRSLPMPRMTNIRLGSGTLTMDDLLAEANEGYYLIGSLGGIEAAGRCHIACQYGYRIRKGKLAELVLRPNLGGEEDALLRALTKIGNDSISVSDGGCLVSGQFLFASGRGGPHALLSSAEVS